MVSGLLDQINQPNDIKKIPEEDYRLLAKEIRRFLVTKVSHTGGHLASNLGAVELTMAMHLCCTLPHDQIIWDVGHQSYTHKILTGRKDGFDSLRQFGGMSGFPKRIESDCDVIDTGHSSTSISVALGLAKARDLQGQNHNIFAVIGDGALTGGMAFEALNNAARLKSSLIIVLNDNQMSIAPNVGGLSNYLTKIRTNTNYTDLKQDVEALLEKMPHFGDVLTSRIRGAKDVLKRVFIPGMLFEDMGLTYIGPIDGHNVKQMVSAFSSAAKLNKAVIVHVSTKKGKGYLPAEQNPSKFHGIGPFRIREGQPITKATNNPTYTEIFRDTILELASEDARITSISAAMPEGTGLSEMAKRMPERFFDVGIAEEHAVTFAAGLALGGLKPVVALYSTFLQRSYDQILHDVCLNNLPVVFAIDRAGLVGNDGETHQGIFDISFMSQMPNMTIMAPKNGWECKKMLHFAFSQDTPVAIRYPRGESFSGLEQYQQEIVLGQSEWICEGDQIAIIAVGNMVETAMEIAEKFQDNNISISVINARFMKPIDETMLEKVAACSRLVVTLEDGVITGGFGQMVASWFHQQGKTDVSVMPIAYPDQFIEHGDVKVLMEKYGLDSASVFEKIQQRLQSLSLPM